MLFRSDDHNAHLVGQSQRIDDINKRIDDINKSLGNIHADLIDRNDETNRAISRLYEVIVRRDEHQLT